MNDGVVHIAGKYPYFACGEIFRATNPENWTFIRENATCEKCLELSVDKK